ncbi:hypothetical protein [Paenibacillus sp. NEAU-GSW1]|uniref:hypothetical protein n=1 Tax=Paenibacillus sp. NEAU-GSW1 TaxID=2682486 RepID=UPI0012E25C3A|nr:hypothetical protein [Paenibacillus sp. NEAU-GSW1]MUT66690.1 hypothetical protein [Paenibacillus sp. NEAU-GSW1]
MNEERRQIIVKEIEHWSRSKLLPEQYCDFLLNLYADQDEERSSPRSKRESSYAVAKAFMAVQRASGKQWLLTFGFFTLISFVVLYFNAFHPLLQIGVSLAGVVGLLWFGQKLRKRNAATGLALTGAGMLLFLGSGLYMLQLHGYDEWGWKTSLLGLCAIFWIVYGIAAKLPIFHLCGWVALLLVYAWLLSNYMESPSWYETQLYWLPLAALFGWSCWFVHRWSKQVSAVLFTVSALLWFMPELYAMLFIDEPIFLQLMLLVKIAVGGGLLFSMRKQWIAWVA